MFKRTALLSLAVVLWNSPALALHEAPVKVTAEGSVILGDDSTIGQAKAAALNNARRAALEKTTGVEVRGSSTVYNFQLIDDLVVTATKGLIVRENVLENSCAAKDGQLSCSAKIEAWVARLHEEKRGDLSVTSIEVHRPDRQEKVTSPVFQSFDEIHIHASANQDAYLNIFSVDQNGNISRLYPNEYSRFEKTAGGKELTFPDDAQRKAGLKLKVRTPKGIKKSVESVLVVATKDNVTFLNAKDNENPTITDLMRELSELDPSQWASKTAGYEVRE